MTDLILHPTASTPVPVTHIKPGVSGKAKTVRKPKDITVAELRTLCGAAGFKTSAKHVKAELRHMLQCGVQVRPAAQDRENAKRKLARAAKKAQAS